MYKIVQNVQNHMVQSGFSWIESVHDPSQHLKRNPFPGLYINLFFSLHFQAFRLLELRTWELKATLLKGHVQEWVKEEKKDGSWNREGVLNHFPSLIAAHSLLP